jgi:acyl dehydratase
MTTVLHGLDAVRAAVGHQLGTNDWTELTRDQVDRFHQAVGSNGTGATEAADAADATDTAGADTAPPWLVLALTNLFMPQLVEVQGVSLGVNYGTGAIRFPAPAPVGSRLRAHAELVACDDISGGVQTTIRITVEAEGIGPVCVVDALSRWLS